MLANCDLVDREKQFMDKKKTFQGYLQDIYWNSLSEPCEKKLDMVQSPAYIKKTSAICFHEYKIL